MKKLRNDFYDKLKILMTPEQEESYMTYRAQRILLYNKYFLVLIMAFQLYNIIYAFFYTNGKFHSISSRVYTVLYASLFIVSLVWFMLTFYLKKDLGNNVKKVMFIQTFYGIFILLWAACITVYDQRISNNMNVYMIISLTVAMFVYFKPIWSFFIYVIFDVAIYLAIPFFKEAGKDTYGVNLNLTILTIMCLVISAYHYYFDRKNYIFQQLISQKNTQLENLLNQDTLTGLKNRRFLENELDVLLDKCREEQRAITFMMIDIDSFKSYNDLFGHVQGDECLRRISWRINHALDESSEFLIRYGGEEFLYIGLGVDEQTAQIKGHHFNEIIRKLVMGPSQHEPMGITISIGSRTVDWKNETGDNEWINYVNEADKALYAAKDRGKDKFVAYTDINQ